MVDWTAVVAAGIEIGRFETYFGVKINKFWIQYGGDRKWEI